VLLEAGWFGVNADDGRVADFEKAAQMAESAYGG
jgi:hypothetical protein